MGYNPAIHWISFQTIIFLSCLLVHFCKQNILLETLFLISIMGGCDILSVEQSIHIYLNRLVRLFALFHTDYSLSIYISLPCNHWKQVRCPYLFTRISIHRCLLDKNLASFRFFQMQLKIIIFWYRKSFITNII